MAGPRYIFDWDPAKATSNLTKHRIDLRDAMTVFADPLALSRPDEDSVEERWITIGLSRDMKLLVVVHTYVEVDASRVEIRIISARKPSKLERQQYEEG